MRRFLRFGIVLACTAALSFLFGCSRQTTFETMEAPQIPVAAAQNTVGASISVTPSATPSPAATPTAASTPAPTPTPLPTPTPTPEPEYIEPLYEEPAWYSGYVDPRSVKAEVVADPGDITVLINKYFAMPSDYVPELVTADSSLGQELRPEADDAWDLMRAACKEECGEDLLLVSGYRSYDFQEYYFANAIPKRGLPFVCSKNAYQGRSEHALGLALDINIVSDPVIEDNFAETTAGHWVNEHCYEYGFVLRYPRKLGYITGYAYEAWHYRYVGVELATILRYKNMTLEEYYGKEQVLPENYDYGYMY